MSRVWYATCKLFGQSRPTLFIIFWDKITQSTHDRDRSCNITWTRDSFTATVSQIALHTLDDSTYDMQMYVPSKGHASTECALRAYRYHHWNLIGQLTTPLLAPNSNFETAGSILTQHTRGHCRASMLGWKTDRRIELASVCCELTFYSLHCEQISLLKTVVCVLQV